mmetsp:Transcript_8835/g.15618  ORF Transcript_8835/g.15618 Transcript_8835/m.15618 type:complete len:81 (+) Transcript_8835:520-762(+)
MDCWPPLNLVQKASPAIERQKLVVDDTQGTNRWLLKIKLHPNASCEFVNCKHFAIPQRSLMGWRMDWGSEGDQLEDHLRN